ncbi:MAG: hypothetical protein COA47_05940 [Robiginitomaculum sp.]|nr:MAG: hypothetical protein COA47_05940 [Robiginitomaculum sp.]
MTRREPITLPAIRPSKCEWCGISIADHRKYCSTDCRVDYNNLCAKEGKVIVQAIKLWARSRGKAGTPGAGMLQVARNAADQFDRDARKRFARHTTPKPPQNPSAAICGRASNYPSKGKYTHAKAKQQFRRSTWPISRSVCIPPYHDFSGGLICEMVVRLLLGSLARLYGRRLILCIHHKGAQP